MNPRDRIRLQHLADPLNSAIRFARNRERGDLDTDEMLAFALVRTIEIARIVDAVRCAVAVQQAMRWQNSVLLSLKPILAKKAVDPGELSLVVGHDGISECDSLSGNEQIVTADRPADLFEPSADQAIDGIGGHLERENVEDAKHRLELCRKSRRCPFCGPIT